MKKITFLFIALIFLTTLFSKNVQAQKFKEIIPLVSTCEDVKKILEVKGCKYPFSNYEFSNYEITINFSSNKNEWNLPKGIVTEAVIVLKEVIKLEEYETNFEAYKITTDGDLPDVKLYTNDKLGIRLTVQNFDNKKYIMSIYLYPSQQNKEKVKRKNCGLKE